MARYTQTINSLTSSRTDINQALSEKLEDTVDVKFSEMGDKIREIETKGGKYKVIVDFGNNYGEKIHHDISFNIYENEKEGKIVLEENKVIFPTEKGQYEYNFTTEVDTISVENNCTYYDDQTSVAIRPDETLTNLKQHKTIKLDGCAYGFTESGVSYLD